MASFLKLRESKGFNQGLIKFKPIRYQPDPLLSTSYCAKHFALHRREGHLLVS